MSDKGKPLFKIDDTGNETRHDTEVCEGDSLDVVYALDFQGGPQLLPIRITVQDYQEFKRMGRKWLTKLVKRQGFKLDFK